MQLVLEIESEHLIASPFLRWAGGKNWFVKYLNSELPPTFKRYHEPFLGGASIFFNTKCTEIAFLSDVNIDLINTYNQVRDNVEDVIDQLKEFKNTKEEYYKIREKKFRKDSSKAAQFIYLNLTSFNGIYRVNRNGKYNVPYGYRANADFIKENILRQASKKLSKTIIQCQDFEVSLAEVKRGDFVFIDPPYTVAHESNGFIEYNQKLFSLDDQYRLAECLKRLNKIGTKFIVTNAFHKSIEKIYQDVGSFYKIQRKSLIGGKGAARQNINEYLIKNY